MIPDWPHWWTAPTLIFSGITGPGGYWMLDPTAVGAMPRTVYFLALGLVLLALGILAMATILGVLWTVESLTDHLSNTGGDA